MGEENELIQNRKSGIKDNREKEYVDKLILCQILCFEL